MINSPSKIYSTKMDPASHRPTEGFLAPPRADESRNSIISNMSQFWRSRPAPASSAASQGRPTKTFVVPLFLSASRSSGRNNLFARGALPAATRSRTSTRSVIDNELPRTMNVQSIHVPRPEQQEQSDLYGSGSQSGTVVTSISAPGSVTGTTDEPTISSRSGSTRTTRSSHSSSSSRSAQTSRRSPRTHRILSKRAYRDPKVNAKAKICFAFGLTLVVAVVICEFPRTFIYVSVGFANTSRSCTCFHWDCSQHHVPRPVNFIHHHIDGDILSPTYPHVHADKDTKENAKKGCTWTSTRHISPREETW
jgi:hypothetical protein